MDHETDYLCHIFPKKVVLNTEFKISNLWISFYLIATFIYGFPFSNRLHILLELIFEQIKTAQKSGKHFKNYC